MQSVLVTILYQNTRIRLWSRTNPRKLHHSNASCALVAQSRWRAQRRRPPWRRRVAAAGFIRITAHIPRAERGMCDVRATAAPDARRRSQSVRGVRQARGVRRARRCSLRRALPQRPLRVDALSAAGRCHAERRCSARCRVGRRVVRGSHCLPSTLQTPGRPGRDQPCRRACLL